MQFLVTTHIEDVPTDAPIIMVDGTVPGWKPKPEDKHFDHHRRDGADIQIDEIPDNISIKEQAVFVTTQLDADACAAAAWITLLCTNGISEENLRWAKTKLRAIAYECDHLGLPMQLEFMEGHEDVYEAMSEFARDAVATLKLNGSPLIEKWGWSKDKKTWTHEQKVKFYSLLFELGTDWLVDAALGITPWPGEKGEAAEYWEKFKSEAGFIYRHCRMYQNVAVLDTPSCINYADPRHLIEWARQQPNYSNITLAVRQRPLKLWRNHNENLVLFTPEVDNIFKGESITLPAYNYTLGSVPLHPSGSPRFCNVQKQSIWEVLSLAEKNKRKKLDFPEPTTAWGGRNEVGGSSWNDAALLTPEEVIDLALMWQQGVFSAYL